MVSSNTNRINNRGSPGVPGSSQIAANRRKARNSKAGAGSSNSQIAASNSSGEQSNGKARIGSSELSSRPGQTVARTGHNAHSKNSR